ncbi:hypothetical protein [Dietzia lutea]|uniref:Ribosomally synthesized peptide with SipW-like signal peptide n=1 Tax=Dietzia lutea TaxID=546160 RepID=A0A2S1R9F7_9ACTN|nr:hypothetical protein [Dietzia lutea]AWH92871.1 hypothetical protein A6035_12630 [Dietzia lutea]
MKAGVTWTLVGASVVLLGFASVQLTDAAWRDSETMGGSSIRTGHLNITGAGQVDLDLAGLAKENMNTGDQVQIPLTVVNDSTVTVDYRLSGVAPAAGTTPPALGLRVARVAEEAACPASGSDGLPGTQLYSGSIAGASTVNTTLAADASDVLCLTATASAVAPEQDGRYVFTFEAAQQ